MNLERTSMKHTLALLTALLLAPLTPLTSHAADSRAPVTPPQLWQDYDPDKGGFKEEIVRQEVKDGIFSRDSYITAYVLGEEIRVLCKYAVKTGAKDAPALLNVHGWMSTANIDRTYVTDGWAQMSFDYCGRTAGRQHFTRYPESMDYGRMEGKVIHARLPDGRDITDPKQTSHYLWYALQRRVLSYLLAQREVDKNRVGAKGYSYGGTLMWNLGMDPRVKAVVAYFGIGWITYYRDHAVWMYNVPYREPPMTPGEGLFLATVESQAHAPYITAATLWLTGSNDHHSGHERGGQTFAMFKPGVPWSFAVQARGHHNTDNLGDDCKLWLEKHVLGRNIPWPGRPQSEIVLGRNGVPELHVTPAATERVVEVQIYQAQKTANNIARAWRDVQPVRQGGTWIASLPVLNVDDYVFSYANIRSADNLIISSDFNAAIPSRLGKAVATDKPSDTIAPDAGIWSDAVPVEGVGGVTGFRVLNNVQGTKNDQFADPRWQAPARARLSFRFYCTEPQQLTLVADGRYEMELHISTSDEWQQRVIPPRELVSHLNQQHLPDWSQVTAVQIKPKKGADITKVVFAQFKWVPHSSFSAESARPNIIVIYTDDHGYADLGCQGVVKDIKTPRVDALAASGVRMLNGYSTAPQCVPSRGGLMTGRFQSRFGLEGNGSSLDGFNKETTIAERLRAAGYVTAQFGKWHLGPTTEITRHGFKHVFSQNANAPFAANITVDGQDRPMGTLRNEFYHVDACSRAAAAIIERYRDQPFLLYVAYRAPHVPLDPPKEYLARFPGEMPERRRKALAMLSAVDDGVGRIYDTLQKHGLVEKTLVFYIGDNGAPLKIHKPDEPDNGAGWNGSLNDPLNGEKGMLAEGGIHVPFVVSWPGMIPGGQVYPHPVSALDVAATAAALAGLPVKPGDLDGVNLVPHLRGEIKSPPHDALYWRWAAQSGIREGKWKLLRGGEREYLYDLDADPGGKHNLAKQHPEIANRLRTRLQAWCAELQPPGLATGPMARAWNRYYDHYLEGRTAGPESDTEESPP